MLTEAVMVSFALTARAHEGFNQSFVALRVNDSKIHHSPVALPALVLSKNGQGERSQRLRAAQ